MKINREFRKIPSLKFLYEVSEDGRIFRNVKSKKQNKIIVDYHHSPAGYCFTFINRDGKVKRIPIARVVAECWLGEKPEGYEIDHIDRNSQNNHYTNLRYVTKSEQMKNRDHSGISKIGSANLEAARRRRMKALTLFKAGEAQNFESQTAAARWLAAESKQTVEHIRSKFKKHRSHVYGYDVIYRNVETACTRSTEQGTVQLSLFDNLYLVGTTDRWNDAKKSEEHDRVKHNIFN
ncbi:MAG: HNH endonuclease [Selenomonadaceae bacterium]|nr:HNH endonuclease [Selenomonadaceae bacterium]